MLALCLLADKPSGRQIAREPLEDDLWPRRALMAATAKPLQLLAQRGLGARLQAGVQ